MDKTCKTCRYWKENPPFGVVDRGECRRHAPNENNQMHTFNEYWCGEWGSNLRARKKDTTDD